MKGLKRDLLCDKTRRAGRHTQIRHLFCVCRDEYVPARFIQFTSIRSHLIYLFQILYCWSNGLFYTSRSQSHWDDSRKATEQVSLIRYSSGEWEESVRLSVLRYSPSICRIPFSLPKQRPPVVGRNCGAERVGSNTSASSK